MTKSVTKYVKFNPKKKRTKGNTTPVRVEYQHPNDKGSFTLSGVRRSSAKVAINPADKTKFCFQGDFEVVEGPAVCESVQ